MKHLLLIHLLLVCFFTSKLNAQSTHEKVIYYDKDWEECQIDEASYYRVVQDTHLRKDSYQVTGYYISGEKQMEGSFLDTDAELPSGKFTWYYKNGNKKKEANLEKTVCLGEYRTWYRNGQQKVVGEYLKNKSKMKTTGILKVISFWDSTGMQLVSKGNGTFYDFEEDDKICASGKVAKGFKHGEWTGIDKSMGLEYQEKYRKGKLVEGVSTDSLGNKYYYKDLEIAPSPNPNLQAFYSYLISNLQYPKAARANNVEGKVYVEFYVDVDGSIVDYKVFQGLGYGCDEEALRIIKNAPNWKAGKTRGKETKVRMILPVIFKTS